MSNYRHELGDKLFFLLNDKLTTGYVVDREMKTELEDFKPNMKIPLKQKIVHETYSLVLKDGFKWFRTNNVNELFTSKNKLINHLESTLKEF